MTITRTSTCSFPGDTAKFLHGLTAPTPEGHVARMRCYLQSNTRRVVVEREDDLLTKQDMLGIKDAVAAATQEELMIWIQHKCISRKPRRGATNILDVRWVPKWKFVKSKDDP